MAFFVRLGRTAVCVGALLAVFSIISVSHKNKSEGMETDQPELDSGVASGGATPTLGRGARDAAG